MNETKPKKMVSRNVAVALGITSIILIAIIAYFSIAGISAQNSYNNLQNQNKQLITWLDGNKTLLTQTQANNTNLQNQVSSYNTTIISLTSNLTNLQEIVNMQESAVLWNASMDFGSTSWNIFVDNYPNGVLEANQIHTDYAGYVAVSVINSTSNSTYLGLSYSSNGFSYDNTVSIGSSGSTIFPILPTTSLSIRIATGTSSYLNITNVTIIYYY
jgi:cell division protein FtsB